MGLDRDGLGPGWAWTRLGLDCALAWAGLGWAGPKWAWTGLGLAGIIRTRSS